MALRNYNREEIHLEETRSNGHVAHPMILDTTVVLMLALIVSIAWLD